jgi:hypothetical protein
MARQEQRLKEIVAITREHQLTAGDAAVGNGGWG